MQMELNKKMKILLICVVVDVMLVAVGFLSGDMGILGNLLVISVFVFVVPQFLLKYSEFVWIKAVEEQFPNFIRSMADSVRSGMSFKEAISIAAKSDFGKLTDEVKNMKSKLSWGVDFIKVLDMFSMKARKSAMITESMNIIKESFRSGGNIAETLDAIGMNVILLKEVEAERASMTRQHALIMYGIFFLFMGITIATIYVMVPMLKSQDMGDTGGGFGLNFKDPCAGNVMFPCSYFSAVGVFLGVEGGISTYYTALFFNVVVILSIFMGLIIGQLGQNSVVAGGKHSLILIMSSLAVFMTLSKLGILPM